MEEDVRVSLVTIAEWIQNSFESISAEAIINGFNKALENSDIDDLNDNFIASNISNNDKEICFCY